GKAPDGIKIGSYHSDFVRRDEKTGFRVKPGMTFVRSDKAIAPYVNDIAFKPLNPGTFEPLNP
ncbi:MAG: hypothetical protein ACLFUL_16205, partial [Desulfobacteraceae bacterium]